MDENQDRKQVNKQKSSPFALLKPSVWLKITFWLSLVVVLFFSSNNLFSGSYRLHPPIEEIKILIKDKALHPPSEKALSNLSMKRLSKDLHGFDQYAHYIPPSSPESQSSHDLRLGVRLFSFKSQIWLSPEPGGPASKQGLPEIGVLKKINGKSISRNLAKTSTQLDRAIRSGAVSFTLYNDSHKTELTIHPEPYQPPPLYSSMVDDYVFIHISDFVSHKTAPYFLALYQTMQQTDAMIILDLRGCPGGDFYEALEIAGMFVTPGELLLTTHHRGEKIHSYLSPEGDKLKRPAYLLLDSRTASAAEILAGILKERNVSPLLGEKSYGKCDSQTVFDLSNGGKFWLTTLQTFFADNSSCANKGVEPDIKYSDISIAKLTEIVKQITKQ